MKRHQGQQAYSKYPSEKGEKVLHTVYVVREPIYASKSTKCQKM